MDNATAAQPKGWCRRAAYSSTADLKAAFSVEFLGRTVGYCWFKEIKSCVSLLSVFFVPGKCRTTMSIYVNSPK